eukprot:COSAG01_NODE_1004_length_12197_cov_8.942718_7_plen_95_part_00
MYKFAPKRARARIRRIQYQKGLGNRVCYHDDYWGTKWPFDEDDGDDALRPCTNIRREYIEYIRVHCRRRTTGVLSGVAKCYPVAVHDPSSESKL